MTDGHGTTEPIRIEHLLKWLLGSDPDWRLREIEAQDEEGRRDLRVTIGVGSPAASRALRARCAALGIEFREE